jgi:hypothetical protein
MHSLPVDPGVLNKAYLYIHGAKTFSGRSRVGFGGCWGGLWQAWGGPELVLGGLGSFLGRAWLIWARF